MTDHASGPETGLEDVAAEYPHWHLWTGVNGLLYARRPLTSPPAVFRGRDAAELRKQIRRWESEHQ